MTSPNRGTWRDLNTGVDPKYGNPEDMSPALDEAGIPAEPITTRPDGPYGLPYFEGLEDPSARTGLMSSPEPQYPVDDVGASPIVGAYEGAYRTQGPVRAFGHEPSGGWYGDQAAGRIMRFPANIPDRYDANGVSVGDYRDLLAATIAQNDKTPPSDQNVIDSLLNFGG